jgi:predicted amidophosphoribosyltransferase
MAKKYRIALPKFKIVNRCSLCGNIIPSNQSLCPNCLKKVNFKIIQKRRK